MAVVAVSARLVVVDFRLLPTKRTLVLALGMRCTAGTTLVHPHLVVLLGRENLATSLAGATPREVAVVAAEAAAPVASPSRRLSAF